MNLYEAIKNNLKEMETIERNPAEYKLTVDPAYSFEGSKGYYATMADWKADALRFQNNYEIEENGELLKEPIEELQNATSDEEILEYLKKWWGLKFKKMPPIMKYSKEDIIKEIGPVKTDKELADAIYAFWDGPHHDDNRINTELVGVRDGKVEEALYFSDTEEIIKIYLLKSAYHEDPAKEYGLKPYKPKKNGRL